MVYSKTKDNQKGTLDRCFKHVLIFSESALLACYSDLLFDLSTSFKCQLRCSLTSVYAEFGFAFPNQSSEDQGPRKSGLILCWA